MHVCCARLLTKHFCTCMLVSMHEAAGIHHTWLLCRRSLSTCNTCYQHKHMNTQRKVSLSHPTRLRSAAAFMRDDAEHRLRNNNNNKFDSIVHHTCPYNRDCTCHRKIRTAAVRRAGLHSDQSLMLWKRRRRKTKRMRKYAFKKTILCTQHTLCMPTEDCKRAHMLALSLSVASRALRPTCCIHILMYSYIQIHGLCKNGVCTRAFGWRLKASLLATTNVWRRCCFFYFYKETHFVEKMYKMERIETARSIGTVGCFSSVWVMRFVLSCRHRNLRGMGIISIVKHMIYTSSCLVIACAARA